MDKNAKILAIVVVVIVIAASGITAAVMMNQNNNNKSSFSTDTVALVYGNANMDYTIDSSDVEMLQSIVDGKTTWDKEKNYLADANADGKITQEDVDLVNKIIKNESCTIYYYNYWGEASPLSYPISHKSIAVTYWQQAEILSILGLWSDLKVANASVFTSSSTSMYDTTGIVSIGTSGSSSSSVNDASVETMLDNDVDLLIASCYTAIKTGAEKLVNQGIQSIFLYHSGSYCLSTILTMGVLLDCEANAQKYVAYCDGIVDTIKDRLDGKELASSIAVIMYENEDNYISSNGGITTYAGMPEGAYYMLSLVSKLYSSSSVDSMGRVFLSEEWFIQNPSQYDYVIIVEESTGLDGTYEKYNSRFESSIKYFSQTDAYAAGKIIGTTYTFGGFAGYSSLLTVAWMLYPDLFTAEEGLQCIQDYYDTFTNADIDVHSRAYYYTGTEYTPIYMADNSS